jgi:hypothetical protein
MRTVRALLTPRIDLDQGMMMIRDESGGKSPAPLWQSAIRRKPGQNERRLLHAGTMALMGKAAHRDGGTKWTKAADSKPVGGRRQSDDGSIHGGR